MTPLRFTRTIVLDCWRVGKASYSQSETWGDMKILVGFGRACAPVRCAHLSFWANCHAQRGAARPPAHRSFAAPQKYKNTLFPETKCFPSGPNSGHQGRISLHRDKLHPTELHCTLLCYAAPSWATRHPTELHCILLSYAAPSWATRHPTELRCTLLSYASPY